MTCMVIARTAKRLCRDIHAGSRSCPHVMDKKSEGWLGGSEWDWDQDEASERLMLAISRLRFGSCVIRSAMREHA